MTVQLYPQVDHGKPAWCAAFSQTAAGWRAVKLTKHAHVYTCGDPNATVYFIESGQIKLQILAPDGKECLLSILTAGDLFGESCLTNQEGRPETAIAMTPVVLRVIPRSQFLAGLYQTNLLESFVHYLALRVAEHQAVIADLVTADSEQRLVKTLLYLARKLGRSVPPVLYIEPRLTHEELAAMVGTTRPRISEFMQRFRTLGLIETIAEQGLVVQVQKLDAYLARLN